MKEKCQKSNIYFNKFKIYDVEIEEIEKNCVIINRDDKLKRIYYIISKQMFDECFKNK